mmetsp:Transcript_4145/g.16053  ORF Transcript_4145/g.16053 Transcript_4145/m.16053 type:complete len:232 (+) Transcript_4145:1399-2094(+)
MPDGGNHEQLLQQAVHVAGASLILEPNEGRIGGLLFASGLYVPAAAEAASCAIQQRLHMVENGTEHSRGCSRRFQQQLEGRDALLLGAAEGFALDPHLGARGIGGQVWQGEESLVEDEAHKRRSQDAFVYGRGALAEHLRQGPQAAFEHRALPLARACLLEGHLPHDGVRREGRELLKQLLRQLAEHLRSNHAVGTAIHRVDQHQEKLLGGGAVSRQPLKLLNHPWQDRPD